MTTISVFKSWISSVDLYIQKISNLDENKVERVKKEALGNDKHTFSFDWFSNYLYLLDFSWEGQQSDWKRSLKNQPKEKITNLLEFFQKDSHCCFRLRGKIENKIRRSQKEFYRLWCPFIDQAQKIVKKNMELFFSSKFNGESFFDGMGWLPENLKMLVLLEVFNGMRIKDFTQFEQKQIVAFSMQLAQSSGLATASILIDLCKQKKNPFSVNDMASLMRIAAYTSGLSLLPYLQDFPFSQEQLMPIVMAMLENKDNQALFTKKEVLRYLALLGLNNDDVIQRLVEGGNFAQRNSKAIKSPEQKLQAAFELFKNEQTVSNLTLLKDEIMLLETSFENEDKIRDIKVSAITAQCGKGNGTFIFQYLHLFNLDEKALWDVFNNVSHYTDLYNPIITNIAMLPWSKRKEDFLLNFVQIGAVQAQAFLLSLREFNIDESNVIHMKIPQMAVQVCENLQCLSFDFNLKIYHVLFATAIQSFFTKLLAQASRTSMFRNPQHTFLLQDPHFKKLETLFILAELAVKDFGGLPYLTPESVEDCKNALAALSQEHDFSELGAFLKTLFRKSGALQILQQYLSTQQESRRFIKYKEFIKALRTFAFSEVFEAYIIMRVTPNDRQASVKSFVLGLKQIIKSSEILKGLMRIFSQQYTAHRLPAQLPSFDLNTSLDAIIPILYMSLLPNIEQKKALEFLQTHIDWMRMHFSEQLCVQFSSYLVLWHDSLSPSTFASICASFLMCGKNLVEQQLPNEATQEKLAKALIFLTLYHSDEEYNKVPVGNIGECVEKVEQLFLKKFQLEESDKKALLELLSNWQKPHLLLDYYKQWETSTTVLPLFIRWFRSVIRNETTALRFTQGKNGEYFSALQPELVEWYKKEKVIDGATLKADWIRLKKVGVTEFIEGFRNQFSILLEWKDIEWSELSQKPKSFWVDQIKLIKKIYAKDNEKQNAEIARWHLLQNLVKLQSENDLKKVKILTSIQEYLAQYRKKDLKYGQDIYDNANEIINSIKEKLLERVDQHPLDSIVIYLTHSPQISFCASEEVLGSCQSIAGGRTHNQGLMARIGHGKQQIALIQDKKTKENLAISTVKLELDQQSGAPVLLMEPTYTYSGSSRPLFQLEEMLIFALGREAPCPLVMGKKIAGEDHYFEKISSDLFQVAPYPSDLISKTGDIGCEYEDTNQMTLQKKPEYIIPSNCLLHVTLKK